MNRLRLNIALGLLFLWGAVAGAQSHADQPAVAYSRNGVLTLTTASGKVLQTLKIAVPIGEFTMSADASKVVFTPLNPKSLGGPLYLLTTSTHKIERLTRGPYFNKNSRSEVYADPDLSPNGNEAVFVIHAQATGDAVETAGPAAVVGLRSRTVKLLAATEDVGGGGAAFANDPRWSPDGKRIVVNFETGASLTDAKGATLQDLSGLMMGGDWTHVLNWLGSQCLIYIAGKDPNDAQRNPARVLNLKTRDIAQLSRVLNIPEEKTAYVLAASPSIRIRRMGQQLLVEGAEPTWTIPYDSGTTFVTLVRGAIESTRIPTACTESRH
jgi:hypothetical protein